MDTVTFGARNLSFGRPGASTLAPWGTVGRSRYTWEHKKGDRSISGPHFGSFLGTLDKNRCLCSCLFPGHLFYDFGVWIWTSGVPKTSIWCQRGCKNKLFTEVGILLILESIIDVFGLPLQFSWLFDALETSLKFDDFSWLPSGSPRS